MQNFTVVSVCKGGLLLLFGFIFLDVSPKQSQGKHGT